MKRAPQEYLRSGRVFVICDADESTLECVVRLCGEDVVLYASDYPHWDSRFDAVQEIRNRQGLFGIGQRKDPQRKRQSIVRCTALETGNHSNWE